MMTEQELDCEWFGSTDSEDRSEEYRDAKLKAAYLRGHEARNKEREVVAQTAPRRQPSQSGSTPGRPAG